MAFECQRDSYKREFRTKVVSCDPSPDYPSRFQMVLEDTILFPEGGGQPEDTGTLNENIPVLHVKRDGDRAVHDTTAALEIGSEVQVKLDWERRWDHMQQHSGQHLITAVMESKCGFKTVSWCLGVGKSNKSFIELDAPKVSAQQLEVAEQECNRLIAEGRPVQVRIIGRESEEFDLVRSRGLPSGSVGPIRVIDMTGVDVNMCCGTHVANLGHLQTVKLLHAEQKGAGALVHFVVGDRVRAQLGRMYAAERALTKLLSCSPEEHLQQVERLGRNQRAEAKLNKSYLREIAELTARSHLSGPLASDPFFLLHREEADMDFMSVLCSSLLPHKQLILVVGGGKKGAGTFMMSGTDNQLVSELGPRVAEILDGKGGGKGAKYQGKVQKVENYKAAFELVKNCIISK